MKRFVYVALVSILVLVAPFSWAAEAEYVILISVDGLSATLLEDLLASDTMGDYASFQRIVDEGATTFNARTDYSHTVTIPNHTCMITGRPVSQPANQANTVHHGYTNNGTPGSGDTLHNSGNPNVSYIAGVFDVTHDNGLSTGLYASKSKFIIYDQSYNAGTGAVDVTGPDDGNDKIDTYLYLSTGSPSNASNLHAALMVDLEDAPADFTFVHYRDPDSAGHASGWGSSPWNLSVQNVDDYLGDILDLVETSSTLQGKTTVIVTTDHGGSGFGHGDASIPAVYTIPFMAWGAGVYPGADLYALNPTTRQDPGSGRPDYDAAVQPIRNGDSGNLALACLNLTAIPGSTINANLDLFLNDPLSNAGDIPRPMVNLTVYPNPANPTANIEFTLDEPQSIRLAVYTLAGRRVSTLADRFYPAGRHSVNFGDPSLASGTYLVRFESAQTSEGKKLLLLK